MTVVYWGIEFLGTFIETILCTILMGIALSCTYEKLMKQKVFWSIIHSIIVLCLNNIELFKYSNAIISIISLTFIEFMIYKKKNIVVILVTFVYAVIDLSIDLIVTQIGAAFFDISFSNSLHQFGRERICCLLSSKILLSIFI